FFFFFQAEDGIRDFHVTGVQTVLFRSRRLPPHPPRCPPGRRSRFGFGVSGLMDIARLIQSAVAPVFLLTGVAATLGVLTNRLARSEERRVGKEGRGRWGADVGRNKMIE